MALIIYLLPGFSLPGCTFALHFFLGSVWVSVQTRWPGLFFFLFCIHYSRIKDSVILWESSVHYRGSLPSRVTVFNKRDFPSFYFFQYTLKRCKIANVSSVVPRCFSAEINTQIPWIGEHTSFYNSYIWTQGQVTVTHLSSANQNFSSSTSRIQKCFIFCPFHAIYKLFLFKFCEMMVFCPPPPLLFHSDWLPAASCSGDKDYMIVSCYI